MRRLLSSSSIIGSPVNRGRSRQETETSDLYNFAIDAVGAGVGYGSFESDKDQGPPLRQPLLGGLTRSKSEPDALTIVALEGSIAHPQPPAGKNLRMRSHLLVPQPSPTATYHAHLDIYLPTHVSLNVQINTRCYLQHNKPPLPILLRWRT